MFDRPLPLGPGEELTPDDVVMAMIEEDRRKSQILEIAQHQLLMRDGKRLADAMEREDDRKPIRRSLADELALPDEEQEYSINRLLPLGGNALFAGRYKAGKTTFNGQLLKAWADAEHGAKYLGEFECYPDPEKPVVTFFNYEMSEAQWRRWMRRVGIRNTHNVNVVHMRGLSFPLALPHVRDEVASWLADANTGLWVIDPASRAMAGVGDGGDNKDVANFVGWLDEIKLKAGVRDLVMNIHMGHAAAQDKAAERALGAQQWSAWADALWFLTLDEKAGVKSRWFSADGRDVSLDKMLVSYQAEDMSVALIEADPEKHKELELKKAVIRVIQENPGIVTTGIRSMTAAFVKVRATDYDQMTEELVGENLVRVIHKGKAKHHYWFDQMPQPMAEEDPQDDQS